MVYKHSYSGYTLIEVLVAMMILALSLTVIFRIFSVGLHAIGTDAEYARAVMVAESVIAATGVTEPLEPGETSGRLFGKYQWQRTVNPYRNTGSPPPLTPPLRAFHVAVSVQWPAAGSSRRLEITTLRLGSTATMAENQ